MIDCQLAGKNPIFVSMTTIYNACMEDTLSYINVIKCMLFHKLLLMFLNIYVIFAWIKSIIPLNIHRIKSSWLMQVTIPSQQY